MGGTLYPWLSPSPLAITSAWPFPLTAATFPESLSICPALVQLPVVPIPVELSSLSLLLALGELPPSLYLSVTGYKSRWTLPGIVSPGPLEGGVGWPGRPSCGVYGRVGLLIPDTPLPKKIMK